jgi:ABC-type uncharacterized transport system auxiliary subunit
MWSNENSRLNSGFIELLLCLPAVLLLTACGGLTQSDKPAISIWWLKPYEASVTQAPVEKLTRLSVEVSVVPGLDTDKILTLSGDAELNHYSGARWTDNLPELLESLTSRTLQSSGRFDVVPVNTSAGLDGCVLTLELQEFYSINNVVRVTMNGQYSCETGVSIPINAKASTQNNAESISTIVASFQQATNKVMQQILTSISS